MFLLRFADPVAGQSFDRLPRKAQIRFNQAFDRLARNPRSPTLDLDIHQLSGYQNVWTLRIPPWRGLYAIDGNEVVFLVFGHRSNIYPLLHALPPPRGRFIAPPRVRRRGARGNART
ncbi:MAG: type II toxin-antitoxin system RelE family toxin [Terriglobia bacterium]